MKLWDNEIEKQFFIEALKNFASPEQLFYNLRDGHFAYVPKGKERHNLKIDYTPLFIIVIQ